MRLAPILIASITCAAFVRPGGAAAQAPDTFGIGSRSTALGGAVTADVSDFSANYYNPAGIVRGERLHLSLGYFRAVTALEMDGRGSNVDPVGGSVFGLAVPGEISGLRLAFGLAVHLPDSRISRTRSLRRRGPRWERYDNRPHRTFLGANVAVRPFDWLLLGGGVAFLATSHSDLSFRGDLDLTAPEGRSRVEHSIGYDLRSVRYPQLGIQVVPDEAWSFGLVYRGQYALGSLLEVEVDALITGLADPIPGLLDLETESINAFSPRQVSLGASYAPTESLRLSAEVTWVDWSSYRSPIGRSTTVLRIDVPPDLADLIEVPDSIESTSFIAAKFRDHFVPRLGVEVVPYEYEAVRVTGRAGYFYERSPVPDQVGLTNLVDTDRHALSLGGGVHLEQLEPLIPGGLTIDAHLQWSILPERVTQKRSLVDPIGDYRAGGHLFSAGLTMELWLE